MNVEVRDAVEADAEALAALVDLPADALRNVVHDRTVRLAVDQSADPGSRADADETDAAAPDDTDSDDGETESDVDAAETDADSVRGFVAFDVRDGTVHVTQLAGDAEVAERLLEEPIRFATNEAFDVAFVVPDSDSDAAEAAEAAGFQSVGAGPDFGGESTTRYRFRPGN